MGREREVSYKQSMRVRGSLILVLQAALIAQDAPATLTSGASMVLINATVLDSRGRMVTDLPASRFRVTDEKTGVDVSQVVLEDTPVSTVILIDRSGSMRFDLQRVHAAIRRYVESSRDGDDFCVMAFNVHAGEPCRFTTRAEEALQGWPQLAPKGDTALLDALIAAFSAARSAPNPRRAVLLLTDGAENSSRVTWNQTQSAADEFNGTLYAVLTPALDEDALSGQSRVETLAQRTGGRAFRLRRATDLGPALDSLDLRCQYVIGYGLPPQLRDGRYHHVNVTLQPPSRDLRVYWRRVYFAANQ